MIQPRVSPFTHKPSAVRVQRQPLSDGKVLVNVDGPDMATVQAAVAGEMEAARAATFTIPRRAGDRFKSRGVIIPRVAA